MQQSLLDDLAKGKTITLVGGKGETVVHTVKVVRGKDEQVLIPKAKLPGDHRCALRARGFVIAGRGGYGSHLSYLSPVHHPVAFMSPS